MASPKTPCPEASFPETAAVLPEDDDLSSCLLNLTEAAATASASATTGTNHAGPSTASELSLALMRRQRELRLVCAANHSILHRLVQAARRDLQRQEIQRRLAIADADVSWCFV